MDKPRISRTMPLPKGTRVNRNITVELTPDIHRALTRMALKEDLSRSQIVRRVLRQSLAASAAPGEADKGDTGSS
jgi:predicted transcriptional regulator